MPLTKAQKKELIDLFKNVDVKQINIENVDEHKQKWFRFGSYNGLSIASEIVKAIPEKAHVAKVS